MERQNMIRHPAVAGQFYPGTAAPSQCRADDRFVQLSGSNETRSRSCVPHAGWMYSGATAGTVYSAVRVPDHVIMLGPNHHGIGSPYAVVRRGRMANAPRRRAD